MKIWDTHTGACVKELPSQGRQHVCFSPDGRWLGVAGTDVCLFETEAWRETRRFARDASFGPLAFSPDSCLLAFETGVGVLKLADPAAGREFAQLADPHRLRADWLAFTQDGGQLIATGDDGPSIQVWNLRALRQSLAPLQLDWDLPSYPAAPNLEDLPPLQLEVQPTVPAPGE